jgi:DNA-directed RNA polymerase subunit RPC12/RpoP
MSKKYKCPNCGSNEFVSEPNQYDIMIFTENGFETQTTETVDEYKVFCRECSEEIDVLKSTKKILLK